MPRKPNYRFDRYERDRAKAAKKAARLKAKQEKAEQKKAEAAGEIPPADDPGSPSDGETEQPPSAE